MLLAFYFRRRTASARQAAVAGALWLAINLMLRLSDVRLRAHEDDGSCILLGDRVGVPNLSRVCDSLGAAGKSLRSCLQSGRSADRWQHSGLLCRYGDCSFIRYAAALARVVLSNQSRSSDSRDFP